MLLSPAQDSDFPAVVKLANEAYRGSGQVQSWNHETGVLEGQRLNEDLLREDLAARPEARLLITRDEADGPILGTVWLEPRAEGTWYLGLLTVQPSLQNRQLGRTLLAAAEEFVRGHDGQRIRMTVLNVRDTLQAWYMRRGYVLTGETEPFPYGDERFGRPLRDDLYFVVLAKEL